MSSLHAHMSSGRCVAVSSANGSGAPIGDDLILRAVGWAEPKAMPNF